MNTPPSPSHKFVAASLGTRVLSALAALGIFIGIAWQFGAFGLEILAVGAILLMLYEFSHIAFDYVSAPRALHWLFFVTSLGQLFWFYRSEQGLLSFALLASVYFTIGIWVTRNRLANEPLLQTLAIGLCGQLICVVFPSFGIYTLRLPNGVTWFVFHLFVVFAGDVFAYFGGILFGKEKLMPNVSPKKTVAGSFTGLGGSILVGLIFSHYFLIQVPFTSILLYCVACGFAAQMGDLVLSLFKRVGHVKDSGKIMPGHGGVLDRLDGVIMTMPFIYLFAYITEAGL